MDSVHGRWAGNGLVPSPVVRQGRQLAVWHEAGKKKARVRVVHGCMKRCQRRKKWAGFGKVSSRDLKGIGLNSVVSWA
jgi:hypothetical protein